MTDNTLATAQNLGNLTSLLSAFDFVGDTDFQDFYRFNLTGTSDINIALIGGADISLIQDFNNNGVLDNGEIIQSSFLSGPDSINLNAQAAGIYYVRVSRFSTSDASYQLNLSNTDPSNLIAQQENLGNLSGTPITRTDSVNSSDTSDFYRFSLASTSNINITLTGLLIDADIRLIRDANNNNIVDVGEVIGSSTFSGTVSESINLNDQAAGNYFVQVSKSSISYTLRLSNAEISNLIAQEANLGNLSVTPATFFNSVGNTDTSDFLHFSLASASDINIALTGLSADADLRLIRDANNNGIVDAGEEIASSALGGVTPDAINLNNQVAGDYFVQVRQFFNNNTNYTLRLSNDSISNLLAEQENLGNLSTTVITRSFDSIGNSDTSDIYRFSLNGISDINIALTGLSADADLRLIRDTNNNGVVDSGEAIASSTFSGTNPDSINLNAQAAGNYFVQVYQFSNNNTGYTLRLSNSDPSNLLAQETNLGNLSVTPATFFNSVGNTDTSDFLRFSLASVSDINIALTGLSADADLRLIRDANNNGIVDAGEEIASSALGGVTPDSINLNAQAEGDYFVQVRQFSNNNTNYTLRLSNADPTNLLGEQENFGVLVGSSAVSRTNFVGNSDTSDIFRFSLTISATIVANLNNLSANANLRLIRDGNNNGIIEATEVLANPNLDGRFSETINTVLNAGDYFLQVHQVSGDTSYDLSLTI